MNRCQRCIQPDTRPGIFFDDQGVCGPCRYFESLEKVDWKVRGRQIKEIAKELKLNPSPDGYHCVVSVSGGKDSTRQALLVRDELGLNPLLVSTACPRDMASHIGVHNIENLTNIGFDMITVYPSPETYKKLMRISFDSFANYGRATELALYSSAPKIAQTYRIKMVFLGENNSLVYGEDALGEDGGDSSNLCSYNTLNGGNMDWIYESIKEKYKQVPYIIPDIISDEKDIEMRYLGYYFKDFNNLKNAVISMQHGLQPKMLILLKLVQFIILMHWMMISCM